MLNNERGLEAIELFFIVAIGCLLGFIFYDSSVKPSNLVGTIANGSGELDIVCIDGIEYLKTSSVMTGHFISDGSGRVHTCSVEEVDPLMSKEVPE